MGKALCSKIFLTHCSETLSPSGKSFLGICRYRFFTSKTYVKKQKTDPNDTPPALSAGGVFVGQVE